MIPHLLPQQVVDSGEIRTVMCQSSCSDCRTKHTIAPHELLIGPPAKVVATGVANIDIFSWERFWEKMFGYSMDSQGFLNVIKDANFSLELQINILQIGDLPYTASAVVIFKTNDTLLNYGVSNASYCQVRCIDHAVLTEEAHNRVRVSCVPPKVCKSIAQLPDFGFKNASA